MLVSAIIANAMSKANIANVNFYSATDQLFDAQLAWEEIYNLLTENDDDYFVTSLYIAPTTILKGTIAAGGLSTITTTTSLAATGLQAGMSITDSAGVVGTGNTIASITLPYTITLTNAAAGASAGDTFTVTAFTADSNRQYVYIYPLTTDFYRLRMFSYQSGATGKFLPCDKMDTMNFGYSQNCPAYRIVGSNLELYDPYNYNLYNLWYYPQVATLTTSTSLSYPNTALDEYMVWRIAADIRLKQNQDDNLQRTRANNIMETMKRQISRDDFRAQKPKDVFTSGFDFWQ